MYVIPLKTSTNSKYMKMSRLLTYATAGIIVGLLLENTFLEVKQDTEAKARKLKKKAEEMLTKKS